MGCPNATAPPLTLTLLQSQPSFSMSLPSASTCAANASLISNRSTSLELPADLVQQFGHGARRGDEQPRRFHSRLSVAHDARQRLLAKLLCFFAAHHYDRRRAVVEAGRIAGRHAAIRLEGGLELGEDFERGVAARAFVGVNHGELAFARRNLHRHNLGLEFSGVNRGNGFLVTLERKLVHLFARDFILVGDELGGQAHHLVFNRAEQPVVVGAVHQRVVAVAVAGARFGQQERRIAHAFHAAGQDDVGVARFDSLRAEHGGFEAGAAHLVHRQRAHLGRHAAFDGAWRAGA